VSPIIKITASLLIIMSCGMAGLIIAHSYASRPDQLKALIYALKMLETEIAYTLTPLPEALFRVGKRVGGEIGEFFISVGTQLSQENVPTCGEVWDSNLAGLKESACLTPGDLGILRSFGYNLGLSDREDQIKNLKLTQEQLNNHLYSAEKLREKNQRMWRTVGFLAGLAVVFILY
jgi:stage III sporulation protein AB